MLLTKIQVPGNKGLQTTLKVMNQLESLCFTQVDFVKFVYQNFYSECTACIPGKIWNFMQANFNYVKDDPFDEIITAPYLMIKTLKGDCDDFALFAKTCIDILGGFNSSYLLLGKEKNKFSHVVCFVNRGIINNNFIDPVIIDGASNRFNEISPEYKFQKIVK